MQDFGILPALVKNCCRELLVQEPFVMCVVLYPSLLIYILWARTQGYVASHFTFTLNMMPEWQ